MLRRLRQSVARLLREGTTGRRQGRQAVAPRTSRRRDGRRQVTYNRRQLYYYVGDKKPGQVLCQNVDEFGGTWLVVRPSGRLVR